MEGRIHRALLVAAWGSLVLCGPAWGATIQVTTTADELNANSACSLREAVQAANSDSRSGACRKGSAGGDVIELRAKRYDLELASTNEDANADGDLDIHGDLEIAGRGLARTTIGQFAADRILDVPSDSTLAVRGLSVSAGDVSTLPSPEGRGGLVRVSGPKSKLILDRAKLTLGTAQGGGAIYAGASAAVKARRTLFTQNLGFLRGGAIATGDAATLSVKRSTFDGNSARSETQSVSGGAISHQSDGAMKITASTFVDNYASAAGKAAFAFGGALDTGQSAAAITNSTFAENYVLGPGAGGGVYAAGGTAALAHVTLVGNSAEAGPSAGAGESASVSLLGSLIDSSAGAGSACAGPVSSAGWNVAEGADEGCGFTASDLTGVGDGLGVLPLANNGGPTQTIKLSGSSAALDTVSEAECLEATGGKDQRGYGRPAGPRCDAGAYERGAK